MSKYEDHCEHVGPVERIYCKACCSKMATLPLDKENNKLHVSMGPIDDTTVPEELMKDWQTPRETLKLGSRATWPRAMPKLTRHGLPPLRYVTGGCSCGHCTYRINFEPPSELQHCYCRLCRQFTGSAFQTWVPVPREGFVWTSEEPGLVRTTHHGRRHMCKNCGAVLTIVYDDDPDTVWPAAGGFDDETLPKTEKEVSAYMNRIIHICCTWKQGWYKLPDDGMPRVDYAS